MMAFAMIAMLCVGFASCGDDDEGPNPISQIKGTWEERYVNSDGQSEITTFQFNSNGTGVQTIRIESGSIGITADPIAFNYTYREDGTIQLKFDGDGTLYTGTCTITGNTMMLRYGNTYYSLTRKK